MEGSPQVVEDDSEKERRLQEEAEKRKERSRSGQSEVLGILALEPSPEDSPVDTLQKAWEATERPKPEEEEEKPKTEAEPEPVIETEPEPPAEIAPEPPVEREAEEYVQQQAEEIAPAEPTETEAEQPMAEEEPAEQPESEAAASIEPVPRVEAEPEPVAEKEPTEVEEPVVAEEEPVEIPEVEPVSAHPEETPDEPEEAVETIPEPVEEAAPEPPEEPEEEKKGIINTLFGRRGRGKEEEKPKETLEEEPNAHSEEETETEVSPETETEFVEESAAEEEPEGPKFQFNETISEEGEEEPAVAKKAEKAAEVVVDEETETESETETEEEQPPERHIGQMLLNTEAAAETKRVPEAEVSSRAAESKMGVESAPKELGGRRIDTMSRAELMELSEKIIIDGTNLRQIYETHLIGERGLRRLITEYLSGHDLHEALQHEVVEHEIDFERDPAMRDLPASTGIVLPDETNAAALEEMLKKADVSTLDSGEQTAFFKARARYEAAEHERHHQTRHWADIILVSVIGVLIILVALVYFLR